MNTTTLLLTVVLLITACYDDCPRIYGKNITSYGYHPDATTTNGYRIDTNGQRVDLTAIDAIIQETTECFATLGVPDFEPPDPSCVKIVIADDWFHPADNPTVQIFPCDLPNAQGCVGVIQNNQIMIVTPDLAALAHELTHVQTGAGDPFPENWRQCSERK